jgi:hypothetical protein
LLDADTIVFAPNIGSYSCAAGCRDAIKSTSGDVVKFPPIPGGAVPKEVLLLKVTNHSKCNKKA